MASPWLACGMAACVSSAGHCCRWVPSLLPHLIHAMHGVHVMTLLHARSGLRPAQVFPLRLDWVAWYSRGHGGSVACTMHACFTANTGVPAVQWRGPAPGGGAPPQGRTRVPEPAAAAAAVTRGLGVIIFEGRCDSVPKQAVATKRGQPCHESMHDLAAGRL